MQPERERLLSIELGTKHLDDERRLVYDAAHGHDLPSSLSGAMGIRLRGCERPVTSKVILCFNTARR
jgi:hypothetical protein